MTKCWGILLATMTLLLVVPDAGAAQLRGRSALHTERPVERQSHRPAFHTEKSVQHRQSQSQHKKVVSKGGAHRSAKKSSPDEKRAHENAVTRKDGVTKGATSHSSADTAAREAKTPITFDGKPAGVAHNPEQVEGATGDRADHKSVLIERDGHYFKRSYYSGLGAGVRTWYWYDTALDDTDPVIPLLPYVMTCPERSDDCRITEKRSSDPERLKNNDPVIAGFWEWWNDIEGNCKVNAVPVRGSIPAAVLMNCTAAGVTPPACNGVCKLYTITGDAQASPMRVPSGNQAAYTCECKSP